MGCCGDSKEAFEGKWYAHPVLRNTLLATLIAIVSFALAHLKIIPDLWEIILYGFAVVIGGFHWSQEAVERVIRKKEVGIDFLMMAATIGSVALGMWDEAAFLVVLYGAAEGLEEYTFAKTRASIRALLDLAPKEARILKEGQEVMVAAELLSAGDIFIVKPGESMPTDGIILEGRSAIDEAPVTGESIPVEKTEGMKVFAATINHDGVLRVKATADFANNTLSKMVHLVEEAREQKGKAQVFIEAFGKKYSPAVLLTAIAFIIVPPLFGASLLVWANKAVVLLVAAAPCALIMSTPVAVAAGIGAAGRKGVLIKGGIHLENLGKIKVIAFDKTGTLTRGKPVVTDVISLRQNELKLLEIAGSLEKSSTHPLAKAILEKALEQKTRLIDVSDFRSLTGAGVSGKISGQTFYLGKPKLFEELKVRWDSPLQETIDELKKMGKTVILVGTNEGIEGVIAIQDEIRPEARAVIKTLHQMHLKTAMLTGDNELAARSIAQYLGMDDVRADLKPEDKIKAIEDLKAKYGPIAMVGDGINDAPALAKATVGIAMGTAGTDAAIEAADTALMGDDLRKVEYSIRLGKKALAISRQNIVFSLCLLAIMIPAALLGWISVTVAVVVHETSEILAVINGLRAARQT
jgi:Cd2+/Zn2+-exporting ATPase